MGKRPQPRLRIDALTGEWRNGEAGEGRGSELCEPAGLRHQAGGVSWRAPHYDPVARISPGPTRWPPGAERRLVPAKSNLKPQTSHACSWIPCNAFHVACGCKARTAFIPGLEVLDQRCDKHVMAMRLLPLLCATLHSFQTPINDGPQKTFSVNSPKLDLELVGEEFPYF